MVLPDSKEGGFEISQVDHDQVSRGGGMKKWPWSISLLGCFKNYLPLYIKSQNPLWTGGWIFCYSIGASPYQDETTPA